MRSTQRILSVATAVAALTSFSLTSCARHAEITELAPARSDTAVSVEARATVLAPTLTTRHAILGAGVGGTAGALISARMDRQAKDLARSLRSAKVERVGEGIQITSDRHPWHG